MRFGIIFLWSLLWSVTFIKMAYQNEQIGNLKHETIGSNGLIYRNFKKYLDHMLNVSLVIASIHVSNSSDCAFECLSNTRTMCLSFNFAIARDVDGHYLCELLATDKYNHSQSFVPSKEFHHYGIVSPCENSPCQNGGTCRALYDKDDYTCDCRPDNNGTHCEKGWSKLNTKPVCFGALNDSYGTFTIQNTGNIITFKLFHLNGGVACGSDEPYSFSTNWGCQFTGSTGHLNTLITDVNNEILFPPQSSIDDRNGFYYTLPGYDINSTELVFGFLSPPHLSVVAGQQFRVWYGEDFVNNLSEDDNSGHSCIEVFALY